MYGNPHRLNLYLFSLAVHGELCQNMIAVLAVAAVHS